MLDVLTLPGRRRAQFWLGGAPHGPLVVVLHGCPDTRHVAMTGHEAAVEAGVRLLCVNRPGYGRSDPSTFTHRSVADDVDVAVRRLVGAPRYAVLGMSVGGGFAVTCAARFPTRVTALALVAAQPPGSTRIGIGKLIEGAAPEFLAWRDGVGLDGPDDALVADWLNGLPPDDAALVADLGAEAIAASVREALAQPDGYLRDMALAARPWATDPSAVGCPTTLWYGEHDDRATPDAGRRLAALIRDSELHVRPDTTHLATLMAQWPEILTALTTEAGRPPQ